VISRRRFLTGFVIALAPLGGAAHAQEYKAQPAGEVRRIGVLSPGWPFVPANVFAAFRSGLQDLGYVEGRNLAIEWRFAAGHIESLPTLAAELLRRHVEVIVSINPNRRISQAARR
jgi:putative ABC transport system substrate-binding protein